MYASLEPKVQIALAHDLYRALSDQSPHSLDAEGLFPIFWQAKRKAYGSAAAFDAANSKLNWFALEVGAKVGRHAQGFSLTSSGLAISKAYLKKSLHLRSNPETQPPNNLKFSVGLEDANKIPFRMPPKAIRSKTSTGANTRFKDFDLSPAVVINVRAVYDFYEEAASHPNPGPNYGYNREEVAAFGRAQRAAIQALTLLDIARNFRASGDVLPNVYVEGPSGRLYGQGSITLQGCIRELRKTALKGHYDIDVDNCHWTILAQLANREGIETPHILNYLEHKTATREHIASELEISPEQAKQVLVALLYGANLSDRSKFQIPAIKSHIGPGAFRKAGVNDALVSLETDLKKTRTAIVAAAKDSSVKPGYIVNAAKRQIKAEGAKTTQLMAHILQGVESEILRACLSSLSNIVLLQHDGFTCKEKIDVEALSAIVQEQTGYRVTFSQKLL